MSVGDRRLDPDRPGYGARAAIRDLLALAGLAAFCYGAYLFDPRAALVAGGLVGLTLSAVMKA